MAVKNIINNIKKGCEQIIDEERLEFLIRRFYESGQNFLVKAGFDPTAPDLHLGHAVLLFKMAQLQDHGAIVQFLIGDFTAQIGDPSGKSATRKTLSPEEVQINAQTYKEQVFRVLDPEKTRVMFNSTWLNKLSAAQLVQIASTFSVARMMERDDFSKRFAAQTPISISEFCYPLLQGYDSVEMDCDIEMGGSDQTFNLLVGRHLQRIYLKKPYQNGKKYEGQAVITLPLLVGLDGVQKMSKSLGNYIGFTESANDIYAKIMSISDELMLSYYELLSEISAEKLAHLREEIKNNSTHPKTAKEALALELSARFWGEAAAKAAKEEFIKVHSKRELPSTMPEFTLDEPWLAKALVLCNLASSTSQARRDIKAGAVSINEQKELDEQRQLEDGSYILQVGRKKFAKAIIKGNK